MTSRRTPTKLDRFIAKRKSRWSCDAWVIHARFARDEIINLASRGILWWYHVNKYRAMRGNRSELAPVSCKHPLRNGKRAACNHGVLYSDVNTTRAVIGRCPRSISVQIHGWRHGKPVLFNMAKIFVRLFRIEASESLTKLSISYLQRGKMEKQRQKEPFTTWECLTSRNLHNSCHCVSPLRDSLFCKNVFAIILLWARKDVKNSFDETVYK